MKTNSITTAWLVGAWLLASIPALAQWTIPHPGKLKHPASQTIPLADPATYPDEDGFQQRARLTRDTLRTLDLAAKPRGLFRKESPDEHRISCVMARLLEDPSDTTAIAQINDGRFIDPASPIAAANWARFYPVFGDKILTPDIQSQFADAAFKREEYLSSAGREDQKVLWMTAANTLPWCTNKGLSNRDKATTLAKAREQLRAYVKNLFMTGQAEWDSTSALAFEINGLLNVYDFSQDSECRMLAAAALDYLVAAYALKYTDGLYCAPHYSGFESTPITSAADRIGWLWWSSTCPPKSNLLPHFKTAVHPQISAWRPNRVLSNLARREVTQLPVEQRNTKATRVGNDTPNPTRANPCHEVVYLSHQFTMASLLDGHGAQTTRFMLAARTSLGTATLTGGSPRKSDQAGRKAGLGHSDGTSRYLQSAQAGPLFIAMTRPPENEPEKYAYVTIPQGITPTRHKTWFVIQLGSTFAGVLPFGGTAEIATPTLTDKQKTANNLAMETGETPPHPTAPFIKISGALAGFVIKVSDTASSAEAFAASLDKTQLDTTSLESSQSVSFQDPESHKLTLTFNPDPNGDNHGDRLAFIKIDDKDLSTTDWSIYGGPYLTQQPGILTINDGREGYTIRFTGEQPVYQPWAELEARKAELLKKIKRP